MLTIIAVRRALMPGAAETFGFTMSARHFYIWRCAGRLDAMSDAACAMPMFSGVRALPSYRRRWFRLKSARHAVQKILYEIDDVDIYGKFIYHAPDKGYHARRRMPAMLMYDIDFVVRRCQGLTMMMPRSYFMPAMISMGSNAWGDRRERHIGHAMPAFRRGAAQLICAFIRSVYYESYISLAMTRYLCCADAAARRGA